MSIQSLTLDQLRQLEKNYARAGKIEGGKYSLGEVRLELLRRNSSQFDTREVARLIVRLSRQSSDGLLTYGELWRALLPGEPWKGRHSQSVMMIALGRVISYCVRHKLPILTVLVVRSDHRKLSEKAIANIVGECRGLGINVGSSGVEFIAEQLEEIRSLLLDRLPEEPPETAASS